MSVSESTIRLLACDMDGTLFRQDLKISAPVQDAIRRAQTGGVTVVLATGRMPAAAAPFLAMLNLHGPQIYANGALVQTVAGEVLLHDSISPPVAARVVASCRERGMHLNAYVGDDFYVDRRSPEAEFTARLNQFEPVVVPDLAEFLEQHSPTKLVIVRLPSVEAGLISQLQDEFTGELRVFSSVPQYVEMVNPAADKGRALLGLAKLLSLGAEQVAAIGDGDNDLSLLGAAGLPIAMGNATVGLKAIARHIVGSVEENGVAEAIDRYVLTR